MNEGRDQRQLFGGILLLGLGLILLLANFGLGSWIGWDRWWPLILILIGLVVIFRREIEPGAPAGTGEPGLPPGTAESETAARRRRLPLGGLILIGLGIAFILEDMLGGEALPALILIALGGALLLRHWSTR